MSAIIPIYIPGKNPSDVSDYSYDFVNFLARGEHILTAVVTASPSGLTIGSASILKSVVTTWVGGGTLGTSYELFFAITTDRSRTETRAAILNCQIV